MMINKKTSYFMMAIILAIAVTFYFSFKLGYKAGEEKSNSFSRILVSTSAYIQILENIENPQKVKQLAKYYLVDSLYDAISAQELNYMPITTHQEQQSRKLAGRIIKLNKDNNIDLFKLDQNPVMAKWLIDYVDKNLQEYAHISDDDV
jgi:hypothetical protein